MSEQKRKTQNISDKELLNGFVPESGEKYILVFPAIRVVFDSTHKSFSDDDKYTLTGKDNRGYELYKRTLTINKDKREMDGMTQLVFQATPRNLKYALTLIYKKDGKTNEVQMYNNRTYDECCK